MRETSSAGAAMGQRRVGRWRQRERPDSGRGDPPDARTYTRTLVVHEERFRASRAEVCLNPESFPGLRIGDLIAISDAERDPDGPRFQTRVTELNPVKGNVQVSIRKGIADLFGLKNRGHVLVRILGADEAVALDFLQLSFSGQYISRGDMWRLKQDLTGSCVYTTKTIMAMGITARADELLVNGKAVPCGLITTGTKLVYRSRSAKVTWLIQLSKEMWEYDDDGQLYEENVVNGLFKFVFQQWQKLGVNHSLTVVLFARTFFVPTEARAPVWGPKPALAHAAQT